MIPDRLAWFSIGAMCAFMICGWPWHPRFSRYERRRRGSNPPAPGRKLPPPPGPTFTEGRVQGGNRNGGPSGKKPLIKPQPQGGRMVGDDLCPPPIRGSESPLSEFGPGEMPLG
jgi:hypothetical protein